MEEDTQKQIRELELSFAQLEKKVQQVQSNLQQVQDKMDYYEIMFDSIMDLAVSVSKGGSHD
jgi:DNA-binding protein YbaB